MAFLQEQAAGKASDGSIAILDVQPSELHQRVPVYIGSEGMVDEVLSYI
jgi:fructose-1,6-bisphosphatase I